MIPGNRIGVGADYDATRRLKSLKNNQSSILASDSL
jgi:hypothetical protein